ncbi:tRNA uridine 5-carboxymethylaminomethyl modification enzyme MnmG [Tenuifilaceae bacterium CYCD]|nr:tRNA uridine 5-carboxymethylaminomethyl modification enzyme MnmG [Tenuifilaceae bacterium CYCD]
MQISYDIIVVGGGHSGCEAAAAAANMGSKTLLISMDLTKLAQMSCNPAIGGIGKGQIVREIDALGGYTGKVTDLTTIHFRMLNQSKGPAMWSPRAQCDRFLFTIEWRKFLESIPNLSLWQDDVIDVLIDKDSNSVNGVVTRNGITFSCKSVILTNGTFLNGLIHIGRTNVTGGRIGESNSVGLTERLKDLGIESGRMKTGTPVRIDGRTVDYSKMIIQESESLGKFSFDPNVKTGLPIKHCYIVHTDKKVHEVLKEGFDDSPLFSGRIKGIGPRYCPSIEDKVNTFSSKDSHQLFLEPEGVFTYEMYLNGFSSSLPWDVQFKALRLIPGFENVNILRPGYAIEYDYFPPTQLKHTLESKLISNLFFAGQINGTTGYEEAAGQGLVAGINAHLIITNQEPFVLNRDQAYIGVMIDDLITKGVDEPYRVFTSRAEFRILIRQDNADERLMPLGYKLGMIKEDDFSLFQHKYDIINKIFKYIQDTSIEPTLVNQYLESNNSSPLTQKKKLFDVVIRPEISLQDIQSKLNIINFDTLDITDDILEAVEIKIKYQGYIDKEKLIAEKITRLEHVPIPLNFNFTTLESLSTEARQKLTKHKPQSIGEAKRIPGISPSDINVLLVYFGR